jgi:acetyl-CoA C-acetyltransferase
MSTKAFKETQNDVVLVSGVRTPFGKFGGVLKDVESVELGSIVLREVIKRVNVPGNAVDEVFYGLSIICEPWQDGKGDVPDRRAVLRSGLPATTVSMSINKACCSSLVAAQMAQRAIQTGEDKVVIAAGSDNMGRAPFLISGRMRWGNRIGHFKAIDPIFELGYADYNPVSVDAGQVAVEYGISREEQDLWALRSQQRYAKAEAAGKFKDEITPVEVKQDKGDIVLFNKDECPRPNTTLEGLSKLKPVYGNPTVTAGNAPGLDTGACALLFMTREKAREYGLKPLATVLSTATLTLESRYIAVVPAPTIDKALSLAGVQLDDIKLIEINEAFAAMPLVSSKVLADKHYGGDKAKLDAIREKINVNGGCIAMGHPVGASGARILMTLAHELRRQGGGLGVCAICGGLAQGTAAVISVD